MSTESKQRAIAGARFHMRAGRGFEIEASIGAAGLLAACTIVCGALLGSAAIVFAAKRGAGSNVQKRIEGEARKD